MMEMDQKRMSLSLIYDLACVITRFKDIYSNGLFRGFSQEIRS